MAPKEESPEGAMTTSEADRRGGLNEGDDALLMVVSSS